MKKQFRLVDLVGSGTSGDPIRPNITGDFAVICVLSGKAIAINFVPDATTDPVDLITNASGKAFNPKVPDMVKIKQFLNSKGLPPGIVNKLDTANIGDTKGLLLWIISQYFGYSDIDDVSLLTYEVNPQ